jgi:hypothetical protein
MIDLLKNIHVSLSRAIEEGDTLKIGIVIGQILVKLENEINDKTNEHAERNNVLNVQKHQEC